MRILRRWPSAYFWHFFDLASKAAIGAEPDIRCFLSDGSFVRTAVVARYSANVCYSKKQSLG